MNNMYEAQNVLWAASYTASAEIYFSYSADPFAWHESDEYYFAGTGMPDSCIIPWYSQVIYGETYNIWSKQIGSSDKRTYQKYNLHTTLPKA
ncbi:MAG: hypothetical protein ACOYNC_15605 [Bacteroidales bacterium]